MNLFHWIQVFFLSDGFFGGNLFSSVAVSFFSFLVVSFFRVSTMMITKLQRTIILRPA